MAASCLYGFALLCVFLYNCDAFMVGDGWQGDWLSAAKPLKRHERETMNVTDIDNYTMYEYESSASCIAVSDCLYGGEHRGDIVHQVSEFRFGNIYSKLTEYCPSYTKCWDDKCDEHGMKMSAQLSDTFVAWMCKHKNGFIDTSCYTNEFINRMSACADGDYERAGAGPIVWIREFRNCVYLALDDLDGCSRTNFFATFFNFVMDQRVKALSY